MEFNWDDRSIKYIKKEDGPLLIDSIGGFVMESIENHKEWLTKMYTLINHLKEGAQHLLLESK